MHGTRKELRLITSNLRCTPHASASQRASGPGSNDTTIMMATPPGLPRHCPGLRGNATHRIQWCNSLSLTEGMPCFQARMEYCPRAGCWTVPWSYRSHDGSQHTGVRLPLCSWYSTAESQSTRRTAALTLEQVSWPASTESYRRAGCCASTSPCSTPHQREQQGVRAQCTTHCSCQILPVCIKRNRDTHGPGPLPSANAPPHTQYNTGSKRKRMESVSLQISTWKFYGLYFPSFRTKS
jgi:hypothetical protein